MGRGCPLGRVRGFIVRPGLIVAVLFAISTPTSAAETSGYVLRWNTNSTPTTVEVTGVGEPLLYRLQTTNWPVNEWRKLLSVYSGQTDVAADKNAPTMLGSYQVADNLIRFHPQFPLERGVTYRAVFRPARLPGGTNDHSAVIVSQFQLPASQLKPTTIVAQVYPSGDVLPENLLKFYVHFSAPMRGGHIYEFIHLRDETGTPVELPFLELDEELWNAEMTRLTLFIDPGRIKRGVQPLEEVGPALETGKRYMLEIDAAWQDSNGLPLQKPFRKSFLVGAQDRESPAPATWIVKPPKAATRDVLTVDFPEPMDHALALRLISVADATGRLVEGASALSDHETRWTFTPREPWTAGQHQLQVPNTIEDLAGNNIGKTFEVDLREGTQRRFTNQVVKLSFKVR